MTDLKNPKSRNKSIQTTKYRNPADRTDDNK